jgi:hypothetical protein
VKKLFAGSVAVPKLLVWLVIVAGIALTAWTTSLVTNRNPLPFPDRDYHVFSAASPQALVALEQVMARQGNRPRFRIDSENVDRTVFANGTIINNPQPDMLALLGNPAGALGFVVADPEKAAEETAEQLRRSGFEAEVILNAEPGLPIAFVTSNALLGSALVFRKHVLKMGPPPPAWTPREPM